jgi:hypothetical protein
MATETIQITFDDIDQAHPAETHTFAVDGEVYSIDLSAANLRRLHDALAPFVKKARKGAPKKKSTDAAVNVRAYNRAVRAWAAKNGLECPERGKIPYEVQNAYNEAHIDRIDVRAALKRTA